MTHVRTQLRNAVAAALSGVLASVPDSRLVKGRNFAVNIDRGAWLRVHARSSTAERADPDKSERTFAVEVVHDCPGPAVEETLDEAAAAIEQALEADGPLQGLCFDWWLASDEITLNPEAADGSGQLVMVFSAEIWVARGDPETITFA